MAQIYISPNNITQPINQENPIPSLDLDSGEKNSEFEIHINLDCSDSSTYNLTSCQVKLPDTCIKSPSKIKTIYWNKQEVPIDEVGVITIPDNSTLKYEKSSKDTPTPNPIILKFSGVEVEDGTGRTGTLTVELFYKGNHVPTQFSSNVITVNVVDHSGTSIDGLSIGSISINDGTSPTNRNTQNAIYPSLVYNQKLAIPITNTIDLPFTWNGKGNKQLPSSSSDGQFIVSFDYGSSINLAINQLVSNHPGDKGNGWTVYDWSFKDIVSSYTSGDNKGNSITWNSVLMTKKGYEGNFVLTTKEKIDWQQDFNVKLTFTKVVSTNPLKVTGNGKNVTMLTNVYVRSTNLAGVQEQLVSAPFLISAPVPGVSTFDYDKKKEFKYSFFGANFGLMTWNDQNGQKSLNEKNHPGDFLNQKAIGTTKGLDLSDRSTWKQMYDGIISNISFSSASSIFEIYALNSNDHLISKAFQIENSPTTANPPDFDMEESSVKNLGTIKTKQGTYTLLTWQATGLGEYGFCKLSNDDTKQLPGSTNAGRAPYFYLYEGGIDNLKITAYKTGNPQGDKKTVSIPTDTSDNPIPNPALDMCVMNNALYVALQEDNQIKIYKSDDTVNWSPLTLTGDSINYGKPAMTTQNGWLYLTIYTHYEGRNIWTSPDGKDWTQIKTEIISDNPDQMSIQYFPEALGGLCAVYLDAKAQLGYAAQPNEMYTAILTKVQAGLSLEYVEKDKKYYVAYQKTNGQLVLAANTNFNTANYEVISLPKIYLSGIPQIKAFEDQLVVVFLEAGTCLLKYIYRDGTTWSSPKQISLAAQSFAVDQIFNMLCITYAYITNSNEVAIGTYLMKKDELSNVDTASKDTVK